MKVLSEVLFLYGNPIDFPRVYIQSLIQCVDGLDSFCALKDFQLGNKRTLYQNLIYIK